MVMGVFNFTLKIKNNSTNIIKVNLKVTVYGKENVILKKVV